MKQLKLKVSKRQCKGTAAAKRLRKEHKIPGIIYGRSGSERLVVDEAELRVLMRSMGGSAALIEVSDNSGNRKLSVMQEFLRDAITDEFLHFDLHEVAPDELMTASLPIHVIGEAYGVKNEGGILEVTVHYIDVKCLPKDLPEFIDLNVEEMRCGDSIHIKELPVFEGVSYMMEPDVVVVHCSAPRKQVESEEATAEEATAESAIPEKS